MNYKELFNKMMLVLGSPSKAWETIRDEEESEEAAMKYRITSIPNIIAFKKGAPVASNLGFVPQEALENFVKSNL